MKENWVESNIATAEETMTMILVTLQQSLSVHEKILRVHAICEIYMDIPNDSDTTGDRKVQ